MSRKNKTLRAFLHQNKNPTIEQAWDHAWKCAQKEFHARSMQDLESKNDRLVEALREAKEFMEIELDGEAYWELAPIAHSIFKLLDELDTKGEE